MQEIWPRKARTAGGAGTEIRILIVEIIRIHFELASVRIPIRIDETRPTPLLALYYPYQDWKPYSIDQGYIPNTKLHFFYISA